MDLLIVESPSKCKTIKKYLGSSWQVEASVGHIRDLPVNEMGLNLNSFEAKYVATQKGKQVIEKLKKIAGAANTIWIATDEDREGEAIAWHLKQCLELGDNYKRITFNEITEAAVKKAIANPRKINMKMVNAQQGRRLLDRVIGYVVSPGISEKMGLPLSGGRVQSPATYYLVSREQEIRAFKKQNHFGVRAKFNTKDINWFADWDTSYHVDEDNPYITDRNIVANVAKVSEFEVISYDETTSSSKPPAPFTTSTLQQTGSTDLKFSTDKIMKLAQQLYQDGFITYMRTDNPNLSDEAITNIKTYLTNQGFENHIPSNANTWKVKEGAQEAHEAIRPSNIALETVDATDDANKLYQLIRTRVLASQMKPAIITKSKITLSTNVVPLGLTQKAKFIATSSTVKYPGWKLILNKSGEEKLSTNLESDNNKLPMLDKGNNISSIDTEVRELQTKPPPRYTEASLVRKLEKDGIGRPSTYASIIKTILKRNYARLTQRSFHALPLGEKLIEALVGNFTFVKIGYTREMENSLDVVAAGKEDYRKLVQNAYNLVSRELDFLGGKSVETYSCGKCDRPLRLITTKTPFWSCTGYRTGVCTQTYPDDDGKPFFQDQSISHTCGVCKSEMYRSKGENGWYWHCVGQTRHYMDDNNGMPVAKESYPCPALSCSGQLTRRSNKGKKNQFWWGCTEYSSGCTYTAGDSNGKPETKHKCPNCHDGFVRRVNDKINKNRKNWICSNYSNGCKVLYADQKGKPEFKKTALAS